MANNEVKIIVTADAKGASAAIGGFVSQLKANWLETSAMAAGAFFTIRKVYRDFAAAAEREEKRMAFTNLAATFHSNADSIIADLKRMSGQSITTGRAIELAGRSMLSGLDPRAMPGLMEFAKTTTKVTGGSAADTFEDFTRAIITGQDRMLRMHGITVDFAKAQKDLAASMGVTVERLDEQHTQYANLTALLETAITYTARLGKDQQAMADSVQANAARLSESYEKLSDSFWKTFGQPAIFMLEVFAERLNRVREIAHMIAYPFQKAGQGLDWLLGKGQYAPATGGVGAEDFQPNVKGRGITSVKNLGFSFDEQLGPGLQSLKDYTEEMKSSLGELAKGEKDVSKEVATQIKDRESAYKNMYEALRYDTEKYHTFQRSLLERQRDEEIAITGNLALAWQAYYARLEELEEARILRSDDFAGGIKVYYRELKREGFTWAKGSKGAMEDFASGGTNAISGFMRSVQTDFSSIGSHFKTFAQGMVDAWLNAVNQMIAQWLMFKAITMIGNLFSMGAGGTGAAGTDVSGAGSFGGFGSGTYFPGGGGGGFSGGSFARAPGSRADSSGETIIVQQTIPITVKAWDGRDAVRNLEANAGTIRRIIGKETKKSRGFAKQMRGNKR